ncbi:MAG: outer membrane lipoprotein carrier protein LolA [Pseudomonadota bacterium]
MKKIIIIALIGLVVSFLTVEALLSEETVTSGTMSLEAVMDRVEARYAGPGFSVRFLQTSTLKAMEITDTATGSIFVKRPGMMRWEYETPTTQVIVADSKDLWIYRPEDNQVMHGAAPAFFGGGKGAGFLSDITRIRKDFDVSLDKPDSAGNPRVKLIPKNKTFDVATIYLTLAGATFEITTLVTLNTFGDETRFELIDYQFNQTFFPSLFQFVVPEGAQVLTLDQ